MLEDFLSYIESNLSAIRKDKTLLAVSGGVDSMVMMHLFRELALDFEVAHINHSTRKGQSDKDMDFVNAHCKTYSIPFHSITLDYHILKKGNFQQNARNARFAFLQKLKKSRHCKWIATAHHKDDRWETFLMHLNRKSGINGLTSLKVEEHYIIHPLLVFSKKQIIDFAEKNNVTYVHDKSNDSDDYVRNHIRHHVTPEITKLYPDFINNVNQSISYLNQTNSLLKELIAHLELVTNKRHSEMIHINLEKVKQYQNQAELLYSTIHEYGFNYTTALEILSTKNTGALFYSENYEGLYDRGQFIVRKKKQRNRTQLIIESSGTYKLSNGKKLLVRQGPTAFLATHLWLDATKIKWPLTIRNIAPGDKFKPHGMEGATKSIKKICTDLKINRFEKEELMVVCQGMTILQIIGLRSGQNYTTSDIKNALTFQIVD